MSVHTKKQYASAYNVLQRITGKDLSYILQHPDETLASIKGHEYKEGKSYDKKSIKNFITAILASFRGEDGLIPCDMQPYHQQYLKHFRDLKAEVVSNQDNQPSEKQNDGVVSWDVVIQIRDELGKKEYGGRAHLLLSMYSYIPPLRQDFNYVRIYKRKPKVDEGNYIVLGARKGKLVMNEYKTTKVYGRYEADLPSALVKVIQASLEQNPREYLFTGVDGQPYTEPNSFTVFSNRTLKEALNNQKVSVSMLRHSYISSQDK